MKRIQEFWSAQVQAEYASATITAQYVHWLQRVAASPDLIKQGLRISDDEMVHAELAFSIAEQAGSSATLVLNDAQLNPIETFSSLQKCIFERNLRFYCLGETVAIPLFKAMLKNAEIEEVIIVYRQILKDEGRHSDYGWLSLAWMMAHWPESALWLEELLPSALVSIKNEYIVDSESPYPALTEKERQWGMIEVQQYSDILLQTISTQYQKQLSAYNIDINDYLDD